MVKRYYVITAGSEVGVHYDHWTNVAPLVKNTQGAVWERADSKEEAEQLYEQARNKGHVRVIPSDFARSPTSTRAQVNTPQRSTSLSGSYRTNPQPSRHTPAPRIAESQSEGHVRNSASHFVPARASPGKMNTNDNPSDRTGGNGSNAAKRLSSAYSERKQYTHNPNHGSRGSSFRSPDSNFRTETSTQFKVNNIGVRVRVESPSWLASYPDDEEEAFITPPLSPIISPKISSGLLGSSKSEPALTFSANFDISTVTGGKPASEDGSRAFRSPKSVQQLSSSQFNHLSPNEIIDLLHRVETHMRAKDSRTLSATSPSTPMTDDSLSYASKTPSHPRKFSQRSIATSPVLEEQERLNPVPSHSNSPRCKPLPKANVTTPSGTKDLSNGNPPNHSVLFSQSQGSPPPASSPASACKNCNGAGHNAGDGTSILERAGLQPTLAPFHSHDETQDPRSPFTRSKKLRASVSPVTFGRPSPTIHSVRLRTTPNSFVTSPARRS